MPASGDIGQRDAILAMLEQALMSPAGLLVGSSDAGKLRMRIYAARRAAGGGRFAHLQVRLLPGNQLAITKGQPSKEQLMQIGFDGGGESNG